MKYIKYLLALILLMGCSQAPKVEPCPPEQNLKTALVWGGYWTAITLMVITIDRDK